MKTEKAGREGKLGRKNYGRKIKGTGLKTGKSHPLTQGPLTAWRGNITLALLIFSVTSEISSAKTCFCAGRPIS